MTDKPWTSVSMPYIKPRQPGEPDTWAEEASQRGHAGTHQLRGVEEVRPPEEVAQALGLGPEDTAIVRRRLVLLDEQPVELADSYYPASITRGSLLAENRKVPGGAVAMLAQLGHKPRSVEESVRARRPVKEEQELLGISAEEWVLVLTRLTWSDDGLPVEVSMMTMIADGRELRYKLSVE